MRPAVFLGVLALMFAAEKAFPARPWATPRLRRLGFHAVVAAVNTLFYRLLLAAPLMALAAAVHVRGWGLSGALGLTGPAELAASLVVLDMLNYWWHRWNHRVGLLWRFHRAHHSDTHVDVTTSLRFHFGELALSGGLKAFWILAWGPSPAAFLLFEAAVTAFAQFHHANIDLPEPAERLVRRVLMTPRLHAAHHTVSLRSRDANYATVFLWWDRLFGSFAEADRSELERLGLEEGRTTDLDYAAFWAAPARL
ncbi:MAG: fatty acid hydroxylase [Elusimicrobia bacterium]|nr:MAG: fatty acid hydroxylase [Elusimicrobiota bacterium]